MPFLLIPIVLLVVGLVLMLILTLVMGLLRFLFVPIVIGVFIWWLLRRNDGPHRNRRDHRDWQDFAPHQRKEAKHVTEETKHNSKPHQDDWSDF